jgi:hypothetical protein
MDKGKAGNNSSSLTRVYKNLNNGLWSIKQRVGGKWVVVGHASRVGLISVTPYVSDKRHDHVRQGNHREVFAWLVGTLEYVEGFQSYQDRSPVINGGINYGWEDSDDLSKVTFHPFAEEKRGFFWDYDGDDFDYAHRALFESDASVYCYA